MSLKHDRIRFGAAYYHEYHRPGERPTQESLDRDLDLMAAAGFTVIRVGESVWSVWEPEDGRFDLEWLQPVLDGAHARGIDVVLGTPTYALPMWLARRYPELNAEPATGRPMGWGARQEIDYTHPAFRFHAERVLRRIVGRYAAHPAVVGYQVDNEPGLHLFHNRGVFQRFVDELRRTYGTVGALNEAWGLVYWSHQLSTWADLWTPDNNAQPQYDLAWRRFQSRLTTEMIEWQARAVRELARPDQWVTTCIAYDRPAIEDHQLGAVLDVTAGNPYYQMQDELAVPGADEPGLGWMMHGTWQVFQAADRMFSTRGEEFLVTETDAQSIGGSATNNPAYPGQWRQAAWALASRGARMVEYWHWHTLHYGTETYWGGVIPHSGRPGRTYREVAALGAELGRVGAQVAGSTPDHDIALLYSLDDRYALAGQPPLQDAHGNPDPLAYPRIVGAFYRGAFEAGRQVRLVRPDVFAQDPAEAARTLPVLVVAAHYVAADDDLAWLRAYAHAGGHLVLGPRTGYADTEARARVDVQPGGLAEAAGAWYDEFSNLAAPVDVVPGDADELGLVAGAGAGLGAGAGDAGPGQAAGSAAATGWAECLVPDDGTTVLARYDHPHLGAWAAVTTRAYGAGRVTVVGTVPNRALARRLARWLVPTPVAGWEGLPESVTVHTQTHPDGRRVHVVHNWSWDAVDVKAPVPLTVLAAARGDRPADPPPSSEPDGPDLAPGDTVRLGSWDVLVAVTR